VLPMLNMGPAVSPSVDVEKAKLLKILSNIADRLEQVSKTHHDRLEPGWLLQVMTGTKYNESEGTDARKAPRSAMAPPVMTLTTTDFVYTGIKQLTITVEALRTCVQHYPLVSACIVLQGISFLHVLTSYHSFIDLAQASDANEIRQILKLDFTAMANTVDDLLHWWSTMRDPHWKQMTNLTNFIYQSETLARDMDDAVRRLKDKQDELKEQRKVGEHLKGLTMLGRSLSKAVLSMVSAR